MKMFVTKIDMENHPGDFAIACMVLQFLYLFLLKIYILLLFLGLPLNGLIYELKSLIKLLHSYD